MSEVTQLVTTKPDTEVAAELKQRMVESLKPVLAIMTEALTQGMVIELQLAPEAPFSNYKIVKLSVVKHL